jgi:hypothetical protein
MVLSYEIKGYLTMFPLTRILTLAAVGALVALTATSIPVRADELAQNLGPAAQLQRAQTYEAFKLGVATGHDRFATKVDLQQEPEQTKMITK